MLTNARKTLVEIALTRIAIKFVSFETDNCLSIANSFMSYIAYEARFLALSFAITMYAARNISVMRINN